MRFTERSTCRWVFVGIVALTAVLSTGETAFAQSPSVKLQCNSDDWVNGWPRDPVTCDGTFNGVFSFDLDDLNGGDIEDGDIVSFVVNNIMEFTLISVDEFGGTPLDASYEDQNSPTNNEKFVIENMDCDSCEVVDGSRVSLSSVALSKYWSAASCGGCYVNANATSRGACEIFEIYIY